MVAGRDNGSSESGRSIVRVAGQAFVAEAEEAGWGGVRWDVEAVVAVEEGVREGAGAEEGGFGGVPGVGDAEVGGALDFEVVGEVRGGGDAETDDGDAGFGAEFVGGRRGGGGLGVVVAGWEWWWRKGRTLA